MRGLSPKFITDLNEGILKEILYLMKGDNTLDLEIRENYINIYYRGGNILKLKENINKNGYIAWFDEKYCLVKNRIISDLTKIITQEIDILKWIDTLPVIKNEMNLWFSKNGKLEREFQQLVLRENNSLSNTDYFICDIENSNQDGRFDMLAVKWISTSSHRKNNRNLRLAIIEMKYSDCSMTGSSGILRHITSVNAHLKSESVLDKLKKEILNVFNIKYELGLIKAPKTISSFSDEKPELIFLIANHDPSSKILLRELLKIEESELIDVKFSYANFMGYGLYAPNMKSLEETIQLLKMQS